MFPVSVRILPFQVSGRDFGIPAARVIGVVRDVSGDLDEEDGRERGHVLEFFGEKVPVFPAEELFGVPWIGNDPNGEVILLRSGRHLMGVRVDCTGSVLTVTLHEQMFPIAAEDAYASTGGRTLGTAEIGARRLLLIDFERPVVQ